MDWEVISGDEGFFDITKDFHNMLQGEMKPFTAEHRSIYLDNLKKQTIDFSSYDLVVIHDAQPAALISLCEKKCPWIWRCHVDLTRPNPGLLDFLKKYIVKYDKMIISMPTYSIGIIPEVIIPPSIDPLTEKNKELSPVLIDLLLKRYQVPTDLPLVTQISRFDKWKDPLGVIDAYRLAKKEMPCRLILMGNTSIDDPEGTAILDEVRKSVSDDPDITIITYDNDLLANTLQTISSVVLQKSTREGFGLTVSEALWKATPVIGGDVGGIPLQINEGETGFLVRSVEECAARIKHILKNPSLGRKIGEAGKDHVRRNFLITRHMEDYLDLFNELL